MKIISWNVNGIRAVVRKGDFQKLLVEYNPDILCLQETKAEQGQAEIDLLDYYEYWQSSFKKGYCGVAIFSKIKPLNILYNLPESITQKYTISDKYGDAGTEGRVITAEYEDYFIVSCYTPNAKGDLSRLDLRQEWDRAFKDFISTLKAQKEVIVCGDLNVARYEIDIHNAKGREKEHGFTPEERFGLEELINLEMTDSFRKFHPELQKFSWWPAWGGARANNKGWRIDYFLTTPGITKSLKDAEIFDRHMGSDHAPIIIEM